MFAPVHLPVYPLALLGNFAANHKPWSFLPGLFQGRSSSLCGLVPSEPLSFSAVRPLGLSFFFLLPYFACPVLFFPSPYISPACHLTQFSVSASRCPSCGRPFSLPSSSVSSSLRMWTVVMPEVSLPGNVPHVLGFALSLHSHLFQFPKLKAAQCRCLDSRWSAVSPAGPAAEFSPGMHLGPCGPLCPCASSHHVCSAPGGGAHCLTARSEARAHVSCFWAAASTPGDSGSCPWTCQVQGQDVIRCFSSIH